MNSDDDILPEYFDARFIPHEGAVAWPAEFWIITACDPYSSGATGNDAAATARLGACLKDLGAWQTPVRGSSPDRQHSEESFAVAGLEGARILALGREFLQNAVFHVVGDDLSVVACKDGMEVPAGSFRAKLRSA
jgi:hypothetical protein